MNKLGFGLMRLPLTSNDPSSIDEARLCEMADRFLAAGCTYFDTAYMYHNGSSERAVRHALINRIARDRFTLATKLPIMLLKEEGDPERIFAEQRERTGADYFDFYLLHALDRNHYATAERLHCFERVAAWKREGLVRKVGFSFHDTADILDRILTEHPEMEFVQLQINYLDWEDASVQSRRCYETAVRHGKDVIVMEPVKGGSLAKVPPEAWALFENLHPAWSAASWAIRFAAGLPNVVTVLSGMSDLSQLEDNIASLREFETMTKEELEAVRRAAEIIRAGILIPCTACRYCTERCPKHIEIPAYFQFFNEVKQGRADPEGYGALARQGGAPARDCIACGRCEKVCPQHIAVMERLRQVRSAFGD